MAEITIEFAPDTSAETQLPVKSAIGGAYEGASRISREAAMWRAPQLSPDREINRDKPVLDARARDLMRNDGYVMGAVATHKDSIVGAQFVLNSRPEYKILGLDETWAEEFQEEVEAKFALWGESQECWPDAAGRNTFTGLVRLALGTFMLSGEVLATAEWKPRVTRPFSTCLSIVEPDRLSNPDERDDTEFLRRGVEIDRYGEPTAYWFRLAYKHDWHMSDKSFRWKRVPAYKPWGRPQVIHIIEQMRPDQTRGVAEMVSTLKEMRMTKKFSEITLQNAIINATYAATLESELPREAAYELIGAGASGDGSLGFMQRYMSALDSYYENASSLAIDGAKIPHLPAGTKLNLQTPKSPGGVGSEFEASLLRHIAASLGLSYEQFTRDYTKTNYASARASMSETWKYMMSRKRNVADRFANHGFSLWLEEAINKKIITSMPRNAPSMYENPMYRAAYTRCDWIGASRGQIDELKETQAAVLRINAGLSTREDEMSRLGKDWRVTMRQLAREKKFMEANDLVFDTAPVKPGTMSTQRKGEQDENEDNDE